MTPPAGFRRSVATVAALNLGYFGIELTVALAIGSVALLADSVDFLEDASLNILILLTLGWGAVARARVGMALAALLLVPAVATLWTVWVKILEPAAPAPLALGLTGLGALAVNLACAMMLARFRGGGTLARAAFLSARNDALANIGIVAVAVTTAFVWVSGWPDILLGLGIAALNADAAHEVWRAARKDARGAAQA